MKPFAFTTALQRGMNYLNGLKKGIAMLQELAQKNEKGFTLIELMIVIAIIGILAAIAVPLFMAYRMRSHNAAAKAVVHTLKTDQSNLNSELGIYGHTEAAPALLSAPDSGAAAADTFTVPGLRIAASPTAPGARLIGNTNSFGGDVRQFAIGIALGNMITADVQDINNVPDDSTFHAFARHFKGDTAYATDNDVENVLLSVSNATAWPNTPGLQAQTVPPVLPPADDIDGVAAGGVPTANWTRVR
jgi:type IV pilus assembly protein PilA